MPALRPTLPLVCALLVPGVAAADAIDELEPGTWYAIPDTPMRAVCPPNNPSYDWNFYCQNVIAAWGGGALDGTRGRLVLWGGGHGDYRGNEVYVFDLHALQWSRPWGPTPDAQIPSGGTHEVYDDGSPGSRHTYSGLTYLPPPHDAMIAMGGSLWQSGSFGAGTWRFGFADNAWTRNVDGPAEMGYGDPSVFDPVTGHVFRRTNSRMVEYDPAADTFTDRAASNGGFWAANVSAALDPEARLMIIIGEGRLDSYDLATDTYVQDVAVAGPGIEAMFGAGSPGVDFDATTGQFVVWGGGLDVFTYDPVAASFEVHAGAGDDPGPITGSGGAFGRFRYVPTRNVFVWVDHADANVYVFRLGEGTGMPPGGDDTGGSSSGDGGAADSSGGAGSSGGGEASASASAGEGVGDSGTSAALDGSSGEGSGGAAADDGAAGCGCTAPGHTAPSIAWLLPALATLGRRRARPRIPRRNVVPCGCTAGAGARARGDRRWRA